jgi:hypothetical protein
MTRKWLRISTFILLLSVAAVCPAASAAPITIDAFTTGQSGTAFVGNSFTFGPSSASGAGIVGGTRTLTITDAGPGATGSANTTGVIGGGSATFTTSVSPAGAHTGTSTMAYNAGGAGLGLNLSSFSDIQIPVIAISLSGGGPIPLIVTLSNNASGAGGVSENLGQTTTGTADFALSFFSAGGINLSNVQFISIQTQTGGNVNESQSLTLGNGGAVVTNLTPAPEPASLALWGAVGVGGLWYARRRQRRKAAAA